jgi:MSHA biogenesis protein MshK
MVGTSEMGDEEKDKTGGVHRLFASLLCAALACGGVQAQSVSDPMRPADARKADAEGAAATPAAPQLQVVITSPKRKLALIDGRVVQVGETVRDATLASVSDSVAVLRRNGERDVLLMHPGIDKKPARRERP